MTTRQALRLHKPPGDPHQRFVSWIDDTQSELEEMVQAVTGRSQLEDGDDTDLALLDKYALLQNFFGELRAAVFDHAWVAGKLDWTKS